MTEPTKSIIDDQDDLELMVNYLNGHLDPAQVEAVRRRLDEDPAFRELVAPLILTWSVPDHLEEFPRPEGEWEREWEKFKRRPGFAVAKVAHEAHARAAAAAAPTTRPPRARRWRWTLSSVVMLALLGLTAVQLLSQMEFFERLPYSEVPFQQGWVDLSDGVEMQMTPGTKARVGHRRRDGMRHVLLDAGTARFRVLPNGMETQTITLRKRALDVETPAGSVTAGESDFTVQVRGDTTIAFVHPLGPRRDAMTHVSTVSVYTRVSRNQGASIALRDLEGARLVKGWDPERISSPR